MTYLIHNPLGAFANVCFPETQNAIPTRRKISVLRLIDSFSLLLTLIKCWEFDGIAMPVVAIKLNNCVCGGNKSVHTKLTTDHVLALVRDTKSIEQTIRECFKAIRLELLLLQIHLTKHLGTRRVFVSALKRTIDRAMRSRIQKMVSANLAYAFYFCSCLPLVQMLDATKMVRGLLKPGSVHVKQFSAYFAIHIAPCLAFTSIRTFPTFRRTETALTVNDLAAVRAWMISGSESGIQTFFAAIFSRSLFVSRWRWRELKFLTASVTGADFAHLARHGKAAQATKALCLGNPPGDCAATRFTGECSHSIRHVCTSVRYY